MCVLQEDEILKSLNAVKFMISWFPGSFIHTFCHSSEFLISLKCSVIPKGMGGTALRHIPVNA